MPSMGTGEPGRKVIAKFTRYYHTIGTRHWTLVYIKPPTIRNVFDERKVLVIDSYMKITPDKSSTKGLSNCDTNLFVILLYIFKNWYRTL